MKNNVTVIMSRICARKAIGWTCRFGLSRYGKPNEGRRSFQFCSAWLSVTRTQATLVRSRKLPLNQLMHCHRWLAMTGRDIRVTCPTGKSPNSMSSPFCKNISIPARPKSLHILCCPASFREGRFAIVTDVGGGMRWTRMAL
jgi:hypothetical protein